MNQKMQQFARIFQKIDVFSGLNLQEIQHLLKLGQIRAYEPDQVVYRAGEPSDEMLILLQGHLVVTSPSGEPIGSIPPGTAIGEMGVLTGQARSATVVATKKSGGVTIRKVDLEGMMARNAMVYIKVLRNMVTLLCNRLADANTRNEQHMKTIMRLRNQIERVVSIG